MIEKYGLFDSLEGDEREYAEADFATLIKALGRDGVRGGANALKVTAAASGLDVNVEAGMALVQGRYYALEDDGSGVKGISLTTASTNPRIDRIVLRLNYAQRTVTLGVITGTEAVAPTVPELTRDTTEYMLSLAQVRIGVGAALLTQEDITDERMDESLCGIFVASADAVLTQALAAADEAKKTAETAAMTAENAVTEAGKAVKTVNGTSPDSAGNVAVKIGVSGASEGHIPVFDANGDIVTSGKSLSAFTRAKMTLSGTTLTITTVA